MRIFSGIARLWSSLEKSLCRKDGRLGKEHDRGGEEKGRRAFACRVARLAEVQWPRVAPATVLFRRFSRKKNPALRFRTKSENGFLPQRLSRGFSILSLVHLLSLSLFLGWHAISSLPAPPTLLHRPLSNLFLPFNFRLHPAREFFTPDHYFSPPSSGYPNNHHLRFSLLSAPDFFLLDHARLIVAPYAVGENKRKWKFSFVSNGDHFFNFSNL